MSRMNPDIDSDENIPTLYTTEHLIKRSRAQQEALTRRIESMRVYVATMKQRQMNRSNQPKPKAASLRERLVRHYRQIVESGYNVAFYVYVGVCALILLVGAYLMLRD